MPWCDECNRFYTPSTLSTGGDCPSGHHVVDPRSGQTLVQSAAPGRDESTTKKQKVKAPWHFWVLISVLAVYLGWRFIQLIMWLI